MAKFAHLAASALVFSLFVTVGAHATSLDQANFTISDLSGPLAGNTYTGTIEWQPTVSDNLTSFSTDFPGGVGVTLSELSLYGFPPYVITTGGFGIELFYAPPPVGNPNAFAFFGTSPLFTYGMTAAVGIVFTNDGEGTVTWGPVTSSSPEPGSFVLLASGVVGMLGAARLKLKQ